MAWGAKRTTISVFPTALVSSQPQDYDRGGKLLRTKCANVAACRKAGTGEQAVVGLYLLGAMGRNGLESRAARSRSSYDTAAGLGFSLG